jgi:hypothetical protein
LLDYFFRAKYKNIYFLSRHPIKQTPGRQDMGSKIYENGLRSTMQLLRQHGDVGATARQPLAPYYHGASDKHATWSCHPVLCVTHPRPSLSRKRGEKRDYLRCASGPLHARLLRRFDMKFRLAPTPCRQVG